MEPLRPLSPGLLDDAQTGVIVEVVQQLDQCVAAGDRDKLVAMIPAWTDRLASSFDGEANYSVLLHEVRRWIYWTRVRGYWLGYLLQEYAKQRYPAGRPMASLLYARAEECVGDADKAQATLELAYHDAVLNQLPETVVALIRERLRFYYWYNGRWAKAGSILAANPLLEHPYHYQVWSTLRQAFQFLPERPGPAVVDKLQSVVEACQSAEMAYYTPIARRWLATSLSDAHQTSEAAEQLRRALEEAYVSMLDLPLPECHDAEIGHLHRLRGETLAALNELDEAEVEHQRGLTHESDLAHCSYWRALSGKELGKVRLTQWLRGGMSDEAKFDSALDAYKTGRDALDLHLMITDSPVARAAAQQLVRQLSDPMLDFAVDRGHAGEAIAEIESLGPHAAADAFAEAVAGELTGTTEDMLKLRAVFQRHLTTVPEDFGDYLDAIPAEREMRRAYRATRQKPEVVALVGTLTSSSTTAQLLLDMRVTETSVALFHVGELQGRIVVIDLADDPKPTWIHVDAREQDLRELNERFRLDLAQAAQSPLGRGPAVDRALEATQGLLGQPLASLAERVRGRHVKLFPHAQMSLLPLHAVDVGEGRLIDSCDVSYGQSLGLAIVQAMVTSPPGNDGTIVLHNAAETRFLAGAVAELGSEHHATVLANPSVDQAIAAIDAEDVRDVIFACHGRYEPEDPTRSELEIGTGLSLGRLFASSVLLNCRSVTMAACSSGLARAEITSESVGLPTVFLAAGAKTVISALWEVNELATALLLVRHFAHLEEGLSVGRALNAAQRDIARMPLNEAQVWIERNLPNEAGLISQTLALLGDPPFAAPVHWAAFTATGSF